MARTYSRWAIACALTALVATWMAAGLSGQPAGAPRGTQNGEWPNYSGDIKGSRYSPLDQINASNFNKLEVAWRLKTDNLGPRPEYKLEGTPLMIKGTLYMTGGTRRAVVALDAKTGEQKWVYSMDEGKRAEMAPRVLSGRGLSYWTDGKGDDRIIYVTIGYRLVQLNARTGQPIPTFGKSGMVDLKEGVVYGKLVNGKWQQVQIPLVEGEIGVNSTPLVVGDTVIVQSAMAEGLRYEYTNNAKGLVRAFDVRTGKQLWRFNTMPGPGEPGNETWENGSWNWTGNTGVWTEMSADPEAGLVYLPVESPTIDAYGGNRPGNNLYDTSLVAVDLKTGKTKWHFQITHHDLWDYDLAGAPLVMDVTIDGKPRKIVGQPGKQGWLYTFDRITGEPIWPIVEKPVPPSDVPGEKASPTQPFPTKPAPFSRNYLAKDDVIDFTPELRAKALENLKKYRWEQMPFVPYVIPSDKWLGTILVGNTMGGVNWEGSSFNPETGIFYTQANNSAISGASLSQDYFDKIKPEVHTPNHIAIWEAPGFGQPGFEAPSTSGYARREPGRAGRRPRRRRRRRTRRQRPARRARRSLDHQAALRRDLGDRHAQRRAQVAGAARRHAGRGAQQPAAQGHEHPEDRTAGHRRRGSDQVAGHRRRPAGDDAAGPAARRDAARVQPDGRQGSRRGVDAGGAERQPDDLHGRRPAVHHRRGRRRRLHERVHRVRAAAERSARSQPRRNGDAMKSRFAGLVVVVASRRRGRFPVHAGRTESRGRSGTACTLKRRRPAAPRSSTRNARGATGRVARAAAWRRRSSARRSLRTTTARRSAISSTAIGRRCRSERRDSWAGRKSRTSRRSCCRSNKFPPGATELPSQSMMLRSITYVAEKAVK